MPLVLGVDSSTQSTKVEARDVDTGRVVAVGRAPHPPTTPPVSEQDPHAWWAALSAALQQLAINRDEVVAMSVAGQQHGLVLLDADGAVIRKAKLWNDTTSAPEAAELVAQLGPDTWAAACGSVPVASFTITKLAWMASHEPELLARSALLMLPHDYLSWRLTGAHVTDRGDASGTGWFSPATGDYRIDLLEAAAGPGWHEQLPHVLAPDDAAGTLTSAAAEELGLPSDVVVAAGTGDNMAAALGLGLGPGDVAISLGTSGTVYGVSRTPTADPTGAVAGFADATGAFLPLVCTLNATKVTDAMASWLGTDADGVSSLALDAGSGPGGPVLVPHFDGERTPNLPDATGSLVGLTTTTSRADLARAAHDGVLCGLLEGVDALTGAGVDVSGEVKLIGGGARSAAYRRRCADLIGRNITVPDTDETVATGAAVQAAALATGEALRLVATRWRLGTGVTVEPADAVAGQERRHAYREVLANTVA